MFSQITFYKPTTQQSMHRVRGSSFSQSLSSYSLNPQTTWMTWTCATPSVQSAAMLQLLSYGMVLLFVLWTITHSDKQVTCRNSPSTGYLVAHNTSITSLGLYLPNSESQLSVNQHNYSSLNFIKEFNLFCSCTDARGDFLKIYSKWWSSVEG